MISKHLYRGMLHHVSEDSRTKVSSQGPNGEADTRRKGGLYTLR